MIDLPSASGYLLQRISKRADRDLADQIVRLRAHDPEFKRVLDWSLAVDEEKERRKNNTRA